MEIPPTSVTYFTHATVAKALVLGWRHNYIPSKIIYTLIYDPLNPPLFCLVYACTIKQGSILSYHIFCSTSFETTAATFKNMCQFFLRNIVVPFGLGYRSHMCQKRHLPCVTQIGMFDIIHSIDKISTLWEKNPQTRKLKVSNKVQNSILLNISRKFLQNFENRKIWSGKTFFGSFYVCKIFPYQPHTRLKKHPTCVFSSSSLVIQTVNTFCFTEQTCICSSRSWIFTFFNGRVCGYWNYCQLQGQLSNVNSQDQLKKYKFCQWRWKCWCKVSEIDTFPQCVKCTLKIGPG